MQSILIQASWHLKNITTTDLPGIPTDVGVDRQHRCLIADKGVILLAKIPCKGEVRARLHEGGVGRHCRMIRTVVFSDN